MLLIFVDQALWVVTSYFMSLLSQLFEQGKFNYIVEIDFFGQ